MVTINGNNIDAAGLSVESYLLDAGYNTKRVAVELNGDIVPKSKYKDTYLCDGDCVEVVRFVGGG